MGLIRSLSTGASSLLAHQQRFDVISNNLANANTIGYKSSRVTFADQFSQMMNHGKSPNTGGLGGTNPNQVGLGVKIGSIQKNMGQGVIESTERPLDMALQGEGFFVFNQNGRDVFSRAGATSMDKSGYLVDSSTGAFLQGYNVQTDAGGRAQKDSKGLNILNQTVSNLKIDPETISLPRQSQNISFKGNLSSDMAEGDTKTSSIKIFDFLGGARELSLTFTKTANPGEFAIQGRVQGSDVNIGATTIQFNPDGTLATPRSLTVNAADLNAAVGNNLFDETTPANINISLADPSNLITNSLTHFTKNTDVTAKTQDGYPSGDLLGVDVDANGRIWGNFTNGMQEVLGQVVIAKFTNPEGLQKNGNSFYSPAPNSGLPHIGAAGEIFPTTTIAGRALEQSNVDMTTQFTDMISTQRAFEAASRTISVSDQLLAEINQLKR